MKLFRKGLRITFNAPAVLIFAGLCLLATILGLFTNDLTTDLLFSCYRAPLSDPLMYLRLFGHVLGHADWEHFLGNIMYILILGPMLEEKYGSRFLLCLMGATAAVTACFNMLLFPDIQILGASGVVFAMILLSSITGLREGEIPLTFILVAVLYIGQQILTAVAAPDNISQMSHVIGGATGAALGFLTNGRRMRRSSHAAL